MTKYAVPLHILWLLWLGWLAADLVRISAGAEKNVTMVIAANAALGIYLLVASIWAERRRS